MVTVKGGDRAAGQARREARTDDAQVTVRLQFERQARDAHQSFQVRWLLRSTGLSWRSVVVASESSHVEEVKANSEALENNEA